MSSQRTISSFDHKLGVMIAVARRAIGRSSRRARATRARGWNSGQASTDMSWRVTTSGMRPLTGAA